MDLSDLDTPPVLTHGGLSLEPLRAEHAEEMAAVLDDPRLHTYIGGRPAGVDELRKAYEHNARRPPHRREAWLNWLVRSTESGLALGYVQATVSLPATARLAWVIGVPHQGAGAGRRGAMAMVGWLRARGVTSFVADIHPDNLASQAIARALSMRGTGELHDGEQRWSME